MLQKQKSQSNSPGKYAEMKARGQMFFADLSRFHSILLDTASRSNPLGIMATLRTRLRVASLLRWQATRSLYSKRLFAKANPEPDFRYFSKSIAFCLVENAA